MSGRQEIVFSKAAFPVMNPQTFAQQQIHFFLRLSFQILILICSATGGWQFYSISSPTCVHTSCLWKETRKQGFPPGLWCRTLSLSFIECHEQNGATAYLLSRFCWVLPRPVVYMLTQLPWFCLFLCLCCCYLQSFFTRHLALIGQISFIKSAQLVSRLLARSLILLIFPGWG